MTATATCPTMRRMARISDDAWRDDLLERMREVGIEQKDLAAELGLTKARISQIFKKGEALPFGFPERAVKAMQRIAAKRAEILGLRVVTPRDGE